MGSIHPQPHTLRFTTLDVFTSSLYSGNPLALIHLPASLLPPLTQAQKQLIAREFNLSETIFLHQQADASIPEWKVDIFTTDAELPFAGHPTIGAAAYVLWLSGETRWDVGTFVTKAGRIAISLNGDGDGVKAAIPHNVHIHKHTLGDLSEQTLGLSSERELREAELKAPIVSIVKGMTFLLVELKSLEALGRVDLQGQSIDFHGVLDNQEGWGESFVAKYYFVVLNRRRKGEGEDVVRVRTRMLEVGMEDPATGSAASALSSWLSLREGRSRRYEVTQGVEMGRSSEIGVYVELDRERRRVQSVTLSGCAVVVMEGSLRI
ncbi:phenazine biosynthesis protein-like protein PhzF family [Stipitochalara longipes BDJ]|nr:phenazine biosynthesis protein-like protein PhzF family [Stipitochalara longipes BDJ]